MLRTIGRHAKGTGKAQLTTSVCLSVVVTHQFRFLTPVVLTSFHSE